MTSPIGQEYTTVPTISDDMPGPLLTGFIGIPRGSVTNEDKKGHPAITSKASGSVKTSSCKASGTAAVSGSDKCSNASTLRKPALVTVLGVLAGVVLLFA